MPALDSNRLPSYTDVSHRQIADLIADFARFSDGRQWVALTRLLAQSVRLGDPTEPTSGVILSAEQFIGRWGNWLTILGTTQHGFVAKHIAVYEREATCFVDALITSCSEQERVLQWGGLFDFVFVHEADEWRINKLSIVPLWINDSPEAVPVLAHLKALLTGVTRSDPAPGD